MKVWIRSAFTFGILALGTAPDLSLPLADAPTVAPATAAVTEASNETSFEANEGQWDERVRFGARLAQGRVFVTDDGPLFALRSAKKDATPTQATVALRFRRSSSVVGESELRGRANYFVGSDPARWRTNVPTFSRVRAVGAEGGVDVVYRGVGSHRLEYDLVLGPKGDPQALAFHVLGGEPRIREDGCLEVLTAAGALVQRPPLAYQSTGVRRVLVGARFRLFGDGRVGFDLDAYDAERELVVDPIVSSTYLGGANSENPHALAVDSGGNVYLGGETSSPDFPLQGGVSTALQGSLDAFVTKLDPTGSTLVYSTYFGGSSDDSAPGLAVDASGAAYLAGVTYSSDLPTVNAFQSSLAGGADGYVAKVAPNGAALVYSTYLHGSGPSTDTSKAIVVDGAGSAFVAGWTVNTDFPTTTGVVQPAAPFGGGFLAKLSPGGSSLLASTFLGGAGCALFPYGVARDVSGAIVVVGYVNSNSCSTKNALQSIPGGAGDGYLIKVDSNLAVTSFATYIGGSGNDIPNGLALGPTGRVYIAGYTASTDYPLHTALDVQPRDGFVSAIEADGSALLYSTYLDGQADAIAVDSLGEAVVVGGTYDTNFPTLGAFQTTLAGQTDAYIMQLTPKGNAIVYSSFLGSADQDGATSVVTSGDDIWVGGTTESSSFPTLGPAQSNFGGGTDAFLSRISRPPFGVSPTSATVPMFASLAVKAFGGSGVYSYAMQSNLSGATLDPQTGVYTAGSTLGVTDVVKASDSKGKSATVAIQVVTNLTLLPKTAQVVPLGSVTFAGSGGAPSYAYSMASNPSGGVVTSGGVYTAGPIGSVTDVVRVTDGLADVATATVLVGPAVELSANPLTVPPKGYTVVTATGGSGTGYTFSYVTNASGGSLLSGGYYTAGPNGSVDDVVRAVDSLGGVGTLTIHVGAGITLSPSNPKSSPKGTIQFTAAGGAGDPYYWSLIQSGSANPLVSASGTYVAGVIGNTVDTVAANDSLGNSALAAVSVGDGLALNPPAPKVPPKGSVQFVATGGSQSGLVWSMELNPSGGAVDPVTGLYVAGATPNTKDSVRVVDSVGNANSAEVFVGAGLSISPPTLTAKPGEVAFFTGSGGSGSGYVWSVAVNGSGGKLDATARYTVGSKGGSNDIILLTDSVGNSAIAVVTVSQAADAGVTPAPPAPSASGCGCRVAAVGEGRLGMEGIFGLLGFAAVTRIRRRSSAGSRIR